MPFSSNAAGHQDGEIVENLAGYVLRSGCATFNRRVRVNSCVLRKRTTLFPNFSKFRTSGGMISPSNEEGSIDMADPQDLQEAADAIRVIRA